MRLSRRAPENQPSSTTLTITKSAVTRPRRELLRRLGSRGEIARDLAYRLFAIAEKKGRSQDAQAYNALALGWPELAASPKRNCPSAASSLQTRGREENVNRDESTAAGLQDPVLDSAVRRIVERFRPLRIILFGSRARGEAGRWSDMDLLVVLPEVRDKRAAMVEALRALNGLRDPQGVPVAVDVIVTTPAEIESRGDVPGSVLRSALREGKVVYERA